MFYLSQSFDKLDFRKLLDINQFMVTKDFFIKNIEEFKVLVKWGDSKILNEKNVSLILFPLVRIQCVKKLDYVSMKKYLLVKFENELMSRIHRKKLFSNFYIFKLIYYSVFVDRFILKYAWERLVYSIRKK